MAQMPEISQLKGRTIGRILIKMGILTRDKIHHALKIQKQQGNSKKLGEIFVELGMITEKQLRVALAAQRGMQYVDISSMEIPAEVLKSIPAQMANTYRVVPLEYDEDDRTIVVAIDNPDNFRATDDLATLLGYRIMAKVTDASALDSALEKFYSGDEESINDLLSEMEGDSLLTSMDGRDQSIDLEELQELAASNPVKKLLNLVLIQAIRDKASDIHFEPFEEEYKMRYRIDGVLYEMVPPPKHIAVALASRIKVMADLDISERRLPQDGRIPLVVQGAPVDLRVSILPTMFGESVVLRVLDRSQVDLSLSQLGLGPADIETVDTLIHRPNGVVVVTGPTGSGKTTTLYSALKELNTIDRKLITTEDPVEYDVDGLIQVQVHPEIGLTFSACLRSILRQDPDVILVGEVRDLVTAEIAVQAALTGHLVFTTLHTNDAPSAVARLVDLGLQTFLITATIEGVVAQRLVRKICSNCKKSYVPSEEQLMEIGMTYDDVKGKEFYYGKGCDICNNTGYKGRVGIYEIMVFNEEIRELVMNHASTAVLRAAARKNGMQSLREAGLRSIYDGQTTIDEVVKETIAESE